MTLAQNMVENEDVQNGKYLEFLIEKEAYGIPIRFVIEIIGMQKVNALPEAPDYVKGIINLRGRIIPIVDMHLRLGKSEPQYTDRTCIVVVETEKLSAGLIVDSVTDVLRIDEKDIVPPPEINTGSHGYLSGIGKVNGEVKLLLDCEKLFNLSEAGLINNLTAGEEK